MRKYFFVYRATLQRFVEYRSELVIDFVGKIFIPISVQGLLWKAVTESTETGRIASYDFSSLIQYSLFSIIIYNLMKTDYTEREIARAIREGDLNKFLSKPIDFATYYFAVFLGDNTPVIVSGMLLYLACAATGILSMNWLMLGCTILATFLGMVVAYMMGFLIAMLAFWMDEVWTLFVMKNLVLWFLTGHLIPLDMFPPVVQTLSRVLPFGYLAYFPTKLLTNQLTLSETLWGLGAVLSWAMVFYISYKLFWNYALRKYGAFGG
ncbi:MAG: ABC-2 family transporter protein [Chloroherpetonaceae bacterium]|nr:ABC-2 family transporter protein [Chloroherpetonaceae bacterium]MCS7210155.1 ABC-2 family transporter protein [Chloroherpetonaceae bacterium]MDW8019252.1 ABC-2 family transporter protein [Chloroherpetonaceae bacterium]MDW8467499.1 ABC-2 family transporter protein [Chloroherpetonaceae bacterium]